MDKSKLLENTRRYRKTKKGLVTNLYHNMKARNKVDFDLKFLQKFSNCKKFDRLFKEWEKNNYNKQFKPSIDRINHKKNYSAENIQWLNWAENRYKQTMEGRARKGKVLQLLGADVLNTFKSQREASIKTGLPQGNLSEALNGKRNYCGGYKWKWMNIK